MRKELSRIFAGDDEIVLGGLQVVVVIVVVVLEVENVLRELGVNSGSAVCEGEVSEGEGGGDRGGRGR